MPLAIAILVIVALLGFLFYAIAHEKGPGAPDVAIGYERAWDELNFGLLWDLSGEELRDGLRRDQFIEAKRAAYAKAEPRGRLAERIEVDTFVEGNQSALVVTRVSRRGHRACATTCCSSAARTAGPSSGYSLRPGQRAGPRAQPSRRGARVTTMRQMAGVLLTGGASRRMGTDKARLVVNGETLAARAARVLVGRVRSGRSRSGPSVSGLPAVQEDPPGAGPLVALLAGVGALGNPRVGRAAGVRPAVRRAAVARACSSSGRERAP